MKASSYTSKIPLSLVTDNNNYGPDFYFSNNKLNRNIGDGSGNPFSNSSYPDSNRHHFVIVNDQATNLAYLYIDGSYVGTGSYRNTTATNRPFFIGRYAGKFSSVAGYAGYDFNGSIDDVRIYNRALSATEVSKLYTITNKVQDSECNDASIRTHPLATEICDLADNDCDSSIDE